MGGFAAGGRADSVKRASASPAALKGRWSGRRSGRWTGPAVDLIFLLAAAAILAELGPYRTLDIPRGLRLAYWLLAALGAGLAGIAIDRGLGGRLKGRAQRVVAVSLLATLPVTLYIYALNAVMLDLPRRWWLMPQLAWQVWVVMLLLMSVRALLLRRVVPTRTVVVPPLPEAERNFRMRLSARRRSAMLIALEAEDHYVRVHTADGSELLLMRMSEAVAELAGAHGYRVHRSWWVADAAIERVRWKRGDGTVRLTGGLVVPVSRTFAGELKLAGWR